MDCADEPNRPCLYEPYFSIKSSISSFGSASRVPYENPALAVTVSDDSFQPGMVYLLLSSISIPYLGLINRSEIRGSSLCLPN